MHMRHFDVFKKNSIKVEKRRSRYLPKQNELEDSGWVHRKENPAALILSIVDYAVSLICSLLVEINNLRLF